MLTVWGRANSFNVQKVLWLAGELALPYRHVPAGGAFGLLDEPAFRAMNPHGKVPVIQNGETVVWESHAILRYLAARHGAGTLWAEAAADRAAVDAWMDWSQTAWQPAFVTGVFWGYYRTPEAQRDGPAIRRSLDDCARLLGLVDVQLTDREWLAGNRFSLADIAAGTLLYRYFELDIDRPSLPGVEAWYRRLQARPAYRTQVMTPFDDLYGRLAF